MFITDICYSLGHFYKKLSREYKKTVLANIYIYKYIYIYIYIFILAWHNIKWCKSSEVKTILLQKIEALFSY